MRLCMCVCVLPCKQINNTHTNKCDCVRTNVYWRIIAIGIAHGGDAVSARPAARLTGYAIGHAIHSG